MKLTTGFYWYRDSESAWSIAEVTESYDGRLVFHRLGWDVESPADILEMYEVVGPLELPKDTNG